MSDGNWAATNKVVNKFAYVNPEIHPWERYGFLGLEPNGFRHLERKMEIVEQSLQEQSFRVSTLCREHH
jgi:hypothetical protein